jgi:hypothetical protein
MDPQQFRIDYEVFLEVFGVVVFLSFFIERALALVFEHRLYVHHLDKSGLKEPLAFFMAFGVVRYWDLDIVGVLLHADHSSIWGYLFTAAVIAGGSKASIKLFHDYFEAMSTAKKQQLQPISTPQQLIKTEGES